METSTDGSRLRQLAHQHMQSQRWDAAQAAWESLLRASPGNPSDRLSLARVMLERGRLNGAAKLLLGTVPLLPDDAMVVAELAQRLYLVGETVAARECLQHPEVARTRSGPALVTLAHIRHMLGEPAEALGLMDRAMAAGVDVSTEHHFRAMLLQFVGRLPEASETLEACLQRWPAFGAAALTLARLRRQTPSANHLAFLREQLRNTQPDSIARASFEFALFKELDDLGQHEQAWPSLARANSIMHARNPYDEAADTLLAEATIRHCAEMPGVRVSRPCDGPTPIFIVGLPRSGTTLLDRMLSNHSQVASAGEISDFYRQWRRVADVGTDSTADQFEGIRRTADLDYRELGERYLAQTQWRAQGRAYYIDKMPINFQLAGFIRRALPQARILHLSREPMAVCFSNFKAMFGDGSPHSYDLRLLARHYRRHEHLRQHWARVMPDGLLDVSYADLVQAPEATMRKVLAFCGLELEQACLQPAQNTAPVSTPSSAQVREAIHTRGVAEWQNYAGHLLPLQRELQATDR